jgi:hypothetical protein
MNGDGVADAILLDQIGRPEFFLGRGDGRFTSVPMAICRWWGLLF